MADDDLSSDRPPYRRSGPNQCPSTCDQFHVAVICALPLEADAIHALFDHHWDDDGFPYIKAPGDQNVYSIGAIGRHNVVLAWLPGMGMANSAVVAAGCRSTFPNIRLALIVGICGGVPSTPDGGEIVLGDIIISDGLVLYDFGRQNPEHFVRKDTLLDSLARPSPEIRALSAKLKSLRPQKILQSQVAEYLGALQSQPELRAKYPGREFDRLFEPTYRHVSDGKPCDECCRDEHLVPRVRLQQSAPQPAVHFGLIATGNTVMKSGNDRDAIAKRECVIAFEMEGAGVWDSFPCVVIKGVCDYADSHKTKIWQRYAAASAAAATKAFLYQWTSAVKIHDGHVFHHVGLKQKELQEYQRSILNFFYPFGSEFEVQKDRNPDRIAGTCEWFINHERFQHWQRTECSSLLWVSADPGCGKSVLAKYLVDSLCSKSNSTTCFFFFKDALQGQSEVTDALRCLLYQIFHQLPSLLSNDVALEIEGVRKSQNFRDLWRIFTRVTMCEDAGNIICILDALDECEEKGRIQLLEALNKLYNTESPKFSLKILVTSRPYALIHRDLQTLEECHPTIHLSGEDQVEQISREIDTSIRVRLKDITRIHRLTEEEESTLIDELTKPQNRTYLWVHLMFEELKKAKILTKHDLITCVHNLPKTVEEEYNLILDRSKDIEKTKKILHIIVAAQRAMSLQEMAVALDITLNHQPHQDLQPHQSPRSHQELQPLDAERIKQNIREACGLFVVIKDSKVYLLHQTAREFLVKPLSSAPADDNQPWHHSLCPMESNRILAEICIWYLLLIDFQKIYMAPDFEQANDQYPLLNYASSNWVVHFQQVRMKRCDRLISSALKLCSPFQKGNPIWFEIYWKENRQKKGRRVPPSGFDALTMASYFGLERVVEELLAVKCLKTWFETSLRISSRDISFGRSALSWATCNGHGCVVKLLLHQVPKAEVKLRDWFPGLSTCVNAKDGNGIAPLSIALGYGYPEIAGQLIKKGAKIEAKDNYQRTSLALAARWGYRDITQLLLEKGADIKTRDKHQMTPLAIATAWGYRDIIQLLLEKGADIEARDEDQRTPLAIATVRGYMKQNIDIIQLLLENGADIEARDKDQMTPLALAAAYGYIGQNTDTIQLLLEKGADIKARDKDQMTPLEVATALGHRDMIQLLLDKGIGTERPSR